MSRPLRLLIVEDSERDATLLVATLRGEGYDVAFVRVETAEGLSAALQQEWDAILADYTLPTLDGCAVLELVKQHTSDLPVIIVSGSISEEVAVECIKRGAADYLLKDRLGRLGQAIQRTLAERVLRVEQRRSEARYRSLVETSPDAIILIDVQTTIVMANQRAADLYQYSSSAQMAGLIALELIVPDERAAALDDLRTVSETGHIHNRPYTACRSDGTTFPMEVSAALLRLPDGQPDGIMVVARDISAREMAEDAIRFQAHLLNMVGQAVTATDLQGTVIYWNRAAQTIYGWTAEEAVGRHIYDVIPAPEALSAAAAILPSLQAAQSWTGELLHRRRDGSTFPALVSVDPVFDKHNTVIGGVGVNTDITAQKEAEEAIGFQAHLLNEVGQAVTATDLHGTITYWNRAAERLYGWTAEEVMGQQVTDVMPAPSAQDLAQEIFTRIASGQGWSGEQLHRHRDGHTFPVAITATPVLDGKGAIIGGVGITADITAQRATAAEIKQHAERLAALRTIDVAITTSLDLRTTLYVVLDQVIAQLGVHATAVLLLDPHTQALEYAAGRGFRCQATARSRLRVGEGLAGRAACERRTIGIPDLAAAGERFAGGRVPDEEGVRAYVAVPLVARGEVKGVLELFQRAPLVPEPGWVEFLEALAGQAAIAVDNTALLDGLQRSNAELALAYDTTIEGWSRALDLRDRETEGHSQRVTELTLALARALAISGAELVHMRRGALLHDIGKMGIPDAILLKPGPLTEEEWAVMRRHPTYAYELLSPIAYLRPALDIPYCHHEKWDGTGYPRGLKGTQIPLAARIFAIADVWDALRSDRPYRASWPEEKVREHIRSLTGTHFDPQVVAAFLGLERCRPVK